MNLPLNAKTKKPSILIVPGYGNSGPQHWQSLLQKELPEIQRVQQRDWDKPIRNEWVKTLDAAIAALDGDVVLVAHSLGCATVVHWASQFKRPIKAAMLVTPSDVKHSEFRHLWPDFTPMPLQALNFKSVVVASNNDPYVSLERARYFATKWGSQLAEVGACGHLATDDGFGAWPKGKDILTQIVEQRI